MLRVKVVLDTMAMKGYSDSEASVILELWKMQSTPSLPSLQGPVQPGMVAPDKVLSLGQIELNSVLMIN